MPEDATKPIKQSITDIFTLEFLPQASFNNKNVAKTNDLRVIEYITQEQFDYLYAKSFELMNRTLAFKTQLK